MLLKDNYVTYVTSANIIPRWKYIDKNDLCNLYVNCQDKQLKEHYLAAIICRYWSAFESSYNKSKYGASVEDAYNWFIEAILYVLTKQAWLDPNNKLYGDKNGPDKCINVCISSRRNTYFQQENNSNRKINHETESVENLKSQFGDNVSLRCKRDSSNPIDVGIIKLIHTKFLEDEFFAIVLDILYNCDIFNADKSINLNLVVKNIKRLDNNYVEYFSTIYKLPYKKVSNSVNLISKKSKSILLENVQYLINSLTVNMIKHQED